MTRSDNRRTIAATIICCNEADRIRDCLDSVAGWADQVIVFDSGSTDDTVEIAKQYDAEVYVTDWPGYGPQRARALEKVKCEWVLAIDADERATPELKAEIDNILSAEHVACSVYKMPWIPFFLGKQLKYGRYASPQARLFLREGAQYPTKQVHETVIYPPGEVGVLKGGLLHYSFRHYHHCIQKHDEYAWLLAQEKYAKGKVSGLLYATVRAWWEFIQQYFFRKLFLDGAHGYLQAIILKQYAFHKYAALWSLNKTQAAVDDAFHPKHRERKEKQNLESQNIRRVK